MILSQHRVENYRNIQQAEFCPGPGLTVICGRNGQGKTNLLESVWLLSGAKSFRGSKDQQLVRREQPYAVISSSAQRDDGRTEEYRIVIGGSGSEAAGVHPGRFGQLDGVDFGRATNLAGHFYAVVFAPSHLSLVKGSPDGRRRFVDAALMQLYPGYIPVYRRYIRALAQKNALLRDAGRFEGAEQLLDSFDLALAEAGGVMIRRRREYLEGLFAIAEETYAGLSSGSEACSFSYRPCAENAEELLAKIRAARPSELRAGCCTVGPHREDIQIRIGGEDARAFGSQGQQRSAALCLKLAEARQIAKITGSEPVMLLDDVLSELDGARRDFLLGKIEGRQVLLTSCDAASFHNTAGGIWEMEAGHLRQVQ